MPYLLSTIEWPSWSSESKEESPLYQMTCNSEIRNIIICAVERQGQLTIPDGDFTLQAFDKISLTGNRVEIVSFHNSIRPQVKAFS